MDPPPSGDQAKVPDFVFLSGGGGVYLAGREPRRRGIHHPQKSAQSTIYLYTRDSGKNLMNVSGKTRKLVYTT